MLQLTSRGSLQVRGLPEDLPAAFEQAVVDAGFLPSDTHDRVRNVLCSPLTGLRGGRADLRPLVAALDEAVLAEPDLAGLSGRFLLGLDDGRGDVVALQPDLTYRALGPDDGVVLVGTDRGLPVAFGHAVRTLVALALDFAAAASTTGAWRVRDLPGWSETLPGLVPVEPLPADPLQDETLPLGRLGDHAVVGVRLGFLAPDQRRAVSAAAGDGEVVVTPWRSLVLPGAGPALEALTATGLVADARSPWTAISACVGAPWCSQGRIDTQTLVRSVATVGARWPRTHVSGCERRCGAPVGPHRDLVAPSIEELLAVAEPRLRAHV